MTGTLLTTLEVAERLGLSSAAVAQAVRSGTLQPAARTSDDYLFTERAIDDYARRRAEAAAEPPEAAPEGSRQEWAGELERLNLWLGDLTDAARAPLPPTIEVDFHPPPPPAPAMPVVEAEPPPATEPDPVTEPEPAPSTEAEREPAPASTSAASTVATPSRQALLVVQPIDRFRLLKAVSELLGGVPGLAEARLESLVDGLASYRLSFEEERPTGELLAATLAPLGLGVILVDTEL